MSTVTYRHEQKHSYKKKGIRHTISENLVDGEFLTLYFSKAVGENDPNFYKLVVKETSKDKFNVKETKGKTETEKEMTKAEFLKLLKKDKDLSFAVKYIEKERGTYKSIKGGAGHKKHLRKLLRNHLRKPLRNPLKKPLKNLPRNPLTNHPIDHQ